MGRSEDESSLSDPLLPEKNVHYSATRDTDSRRATAFSDPSLSEEERQERDDREETQEREEMFDRRKRGGKGQEQRRQSGKSEGFCVGGRAEPGSSHETAKIPQVRSFKRGTAALARSRRLPWIVIDDEGRRSYLFADKRSLISKAGLFIPPRDTRLLGKQHDIGEYSYTCIYAHTQTQWMYIIMDDDVVMEELLHITSAHTSGSSYG